MASLCQIILKYDQMNLVIETDIGHDPDDFFTICYLAAIGVKIRAISIVPGDTDQIAFARFVCERLGLDIPIGASKTSTKLSSGGVHHNLLKKHNKSLESFVDLTGAEAIAEATSNYDCEFLAIGPATNVGNYLKTFCKSIDRLTMQGGFAPYSLHKPELICDKFIDLETVPTFNMNGDRKAVDLILDSNICHRQFVGKNVCHTVLYNAEKHSRFKWNDHPAVELFKEGMDIYLDKHPEKKFHDPVAAVCHVHPEIATWFRGVPTKAGAGWTTTPKDNGDYVCVEINHEKFWDYLCEFK